MLYLFIHLIILVNLYRYIIFFLLFTTEFILAISYCYFILFINFMFLAFVVLCF